jgi:uncharacterized YigZ family protein
MDTESTDIYKTIQSTSKGEYKDRGSRFMAFAYAVDSEDKIKSHLQFLRKEYHDAKHYCYAYRLGTGNIQYRVNDDGEPSGTAGKPIYGQILSFGLTNILLVVVRYFGGTLLGTSGLINAYREAAKDCLRNATFLELTVCQKFSLYFDYNQMNAVMRIIKEEGAIIQEQQFGLECTLACSIRKSHTDQIYKRLERLEHVRLTKI